MNLLDIANLRDQLKEDVLVVERFMDIARREGRVKDPPPMEPAPTFQDGVHSMARNCISAMNLIEQGKWSPTDGRLWLRAVISNDKPYLHKISEQIATAMGLTDREAQRPPTIEEQLREMDPKQTLTTFTCATCRRELPVKLKLAPFDDSFGVAECLDCQEVRRPLKAKECKSC